MSDLYRSTGKKKWNPFTKGLITAIERGQTRVTPDSSFKVLSYEECLKGLNLSSLKDQRKL